MQELFLPTEKNNYRARLLSLPALSLFTLVLVLFNAFVTPVIAASSINISSATLLEVHNEERKRAGLPPLKIDSVLTNSAQRKAQAMLANDCWSHYCPDGKSPWDFLDEAGYNYKVAGENLAEGFYNIEDVIVAWMNSPTHRDNILKPDYEEVGFGIVQGDFQGQENNVVIAVHFAAPATLIPTGDKIKVTEQGQLPTPSISEPVSGSAFSKSNVDIKGAAPEATQVTLYNRGNQWAVADADEGIFTYRATNLTEDEYSITAISQIGIRKSNPSTPVTFEVDFTPNEILQTQIVVTQLEDGKITLQINEPKLSKVKLRLPEQNIELHQAANFIWEAQVDEGVFVSGQTFTVETTDKAGNLWSKQFSSQLILDQVSQLNLTPGEEGGGRVISVTTKSSVNLIFLVTLAGLFGADFVTLARTGLTRKFSKSQLHVGLLLIVLLASATGGFTGNILEGLKVFQ